MDKKPNEPTAADCSPVFSLAGAMPAGSEMAWKTANPNPDAALAAHRRAGHGESLSIAGAMPGQPEAEWRTAMPDPTRDVLDPYGHVITKVEAAARAELARTRQASALGRGARKPKNAA